MHGPCILCRFIGPGLPLLSLHLRPWLIEIRCSACVFGFATGQDGKVQSLVNFPDVVFERLLLQEVSRAVHVLCTKYAFFRWSGA
jgi:hypothetical protein